MYGGTPDKGIHQGDVRRRRRRRGRPLRRERPEARAHLAGLDEHQCRVTCDGETVVGIYQPIDPDAYRALRRRVATAGRSCDRRADRRHRGRAARVVRGWLRLRGSSSAPSGRGGELAADQLGRQRPRAVGRSTCAGATATASTRRVRCVMLVKAEAGQLETTLGPEFETSPALGHRRAVADARCGSTPTAPRSASRSSSPSASPAPPTSSLLRRRPATPRSARSRSTWPMRAAAAAHRRLATAGVDASCPVSRRRRRRARSSTTGRSCSSASGSSRCPPSSTPSAGCAITRRSTERVSIVHGDLRFGNLLYDGGRIYRAARLGDGAPRRSRRGSRRGCTARWSLERSCRSTTSWPRLRR